MEGILGHDLLKTGHPVGGGTPFIPMKAARWCFEAKKSQLPCYENYLDHQLSRLSSGLAPG